MGLSPCGDILSAVFFSSNETSPRWNVFLPVHPSTKKNEFLDFLKLPGSCFNYMFSCLAKRVSYRNERVVTHLESSLAARQISHYVGEWHPMARRDLGEVTTEALLPPSAPWPRSCCCSGDLLIFFLAEERPSQGL